MGIMVNKTMLNYIQTFNHVTHVALSEVNTVLQVSIVIVTNNIILNSVPKSLNVCNKCFLDIFILH